jgi:hypothetical protein
MLAWMALGLHRNEENSWSAMLCIRHCAPCVRQRITIPKDDMRAFECGSLLYVMLVLLHQLLPHDGGLHLLAGRFATELDSLDFASTREKRRFVLSRVGNVRGTSNQFRGLTCAVLGIAAARSKAPNHICRVCRHA